MRLAVALRVAVRSFALQPLRSAVLACGFGCGIAAMAGLLGIGEVILEQSRSPQLAGGGDLVLRAASGDLGSTRFLVSAVLQSPPLGDEIAVAAPSRSETLYLIDEARPPLRVFARGGIPSLERQLSDYETAGLTAWQDTAADRRWAEPDADDVLRAMDRFHAMPDGTPWTDSWVEWLYFNGSGRDGKFYLTFWVGADGKAGVRLQLERAGETVTYASTAELSASEVLARAPDLRIGGSQVVLDGLHYRIRLELDGLSGDLVLQAVPGRSLPPIVVRGARGWISGYTVPVLAGPLTGRLRTVDGEIAFDGGSGYHDHNWGFWEGVTWHWGQVAAGDLSFVFGRIRPPADAIDPSRLPGLVVALGPAGPLGFATDVTITEHGTSEDGVPRLIEVDGRGEELELRMTVDVRSFVRTDAFLQLRGDYRVEGQVGERQIAFSAPGSAETFIPATR